LRGDERQRQRAPGIAAQGSQFLERVAVSAGLARKHSKLAGDVAPASPPARRVKQPHQAQPRQSALAALGLGRRSVAERYLQQRANEIDAAQPGVHRLDEARIGIEEARNSRARFEDVVERQAAVPGESATDPFHERADLRPIDAYSEDLAAARSFDDLPVDVVGNEPAMVEYSFERSRHLGLNDKPVGAIAPLCQRAQKVVPVARIADPPDAVARGSERGLDEERIGAAGDGISRRDDLGRGSRHVEPSEQPAESRLALHLLECIELRQRHAERGREALACRGKQIGLLMHRDQRLDLAPFHDLDHRGQTAVRVDARSRRMTDMTDKAREASKAPRVAGDQLDPVPGKPQGRDRFSRREARTFAEEDSWPLSSHERALLGSPRGVYRGWRPAAPAPALPADRSVR
jgi:hypothetical protein